MYLIKYTSLSIIQNKLKTVKIKTMLKTIENLGKSLTKDQQREVKGGFNLPRFCRTNRDCQVFPLGPGDVSCVGGGRFGPWGSCIFN